MYSKNDEREKLEEPSVNIFTFTHIIKRKFCSTPNYAIMVCESYQLAREKKPLPGIGFVNLDQPQAALTPSQLPKPAPNEDTE